ncbi:MAG: virulence RhuM family protein [Chloroflexi bacterium]|nr:virulence RhuM family protein [Chloroflexota bacterium]MCC6894283.1 virulence RhuM family protein [Anaerolineae bacterium]
MSDTGNILLYQSDDGQVNIEVNVKDETVWLSQAQMAQLFQTERSVITKHINNIYKDGELDKNSTCAKIAQVQNEGNRVVSRSVDFYNLHMIISLGYRVKSSRGVQFRIWATKALSEFMVKGFVMDDDRLSGKKANYFDELLERVRRIRTSEANFYDKVKAVFSTSIDYQPGADVAGKFYSTVQNKFHFAIHGQTAAELIVNRVNAYKHDMGLVYKKGERITRDEAEVAKNYLEETELKRLELLVEQFLSFAELQSLEQRPMYMADWQRKLDEFIKLNDKQVLTNSGKISQKYMKSVVKEEFEKYRSIASGVGMTKKELKESLTEIVDTSEDED